MSAAEPPESNANGHPAVQQSAAGAAERPESNGHSAMMQHRAAAAKTPESINGALAHIDPTAGPRNKLVRDLWWMMASPGMLRETDATSAARP